MQHLPVSPVAPVEDDQVGALGDVFERRGELRQKLQGNFVIGQSSLARRIAANFVRAVDDPDGGQLYGEHGSYNDSS